MSQLATASKSTKSAVTGPPPGAAVGAFANPAHIHTKTVKLARNTIQCATWNVRTLLQPASEIFLAQSMARYEVDIACLQETRIPDNGAKNLYVPDPEDPDNLRVAYKLLYSGPSDGRGLHGVAIAMKVKYESAILEWNPINSRIAHIRLSAKPCNLAVVCAYAPTEDANDEAKDDFYEDLSRVLKHIPKADVLIVGGDFNCKIGEPTLAEKRHIGNFCQRSDRNENGARFVSCAMAHDLTVATTLFQRRPHKLPTWRSNDNKTRNQIDHIMIRARWRTSITQVRTRWNELFLASDHALVTY
jgi:exonuclease III